MANETAIGRDSDHRELAIFKSVEDRGFRSFASRLHSLESFVSNLSRASALPSKATYSPGDGLGEHAKFFKPVSTSY